MDKALGEGVGGGKCVTMMAGQRNCTHVRERSQCARKKAHAQEGSSPDPLSSLEPVLHH